MITLKLDSVNAQYILGMQTVGLCYAQLVNIPLFTACEYSFETNPFCHASTKLTCQLKTVFLAEFRVLRILHLCTQKSVCATNFGPFGEIGANFSVQLSSRTQFAKIDPFHIVISLSNRSSIEKSKKSFLKMKGQIGY